MDAYVQEKYELARALDKAALALEKEARRLRRFGNETRAQAARWIELNKRIATAPHLVEWLKACGSADPVNEAAAQLGTIPEFIEAHYREFKRRLPERKRRQRDREIVRLAKNGWTNHGIAERTGVSISTVKRALKASDMGLYIPPRKGLPKRKLIPPKVTRP